MTIDYTEPTLVRIDRYTSIQEHVDLWETGQIDLEFLVKQLKFLCLDEKEYAELLLRLGIES